MIFNDYCPPPLTSHDVGVSLLTVGIILLYVIIIVWLATEFESDWLIAVGLIAPFIAAGIWLL